MPISSESIVITAVGMVSSLGLDVVTSCAAARAGMTNTTVLEDVAVKEGDTDELEPVSVHAVPVIMDGFTGMGRLVRLGAAALTDLMDAGDVPDDGRTGFYVNLSSGFYFLEREKWVEQQTGVDGKLDGQYEMEWRQAKYQQELIPKLTRLTGMQHAPASEAVFFGDQAGFIDVLQQAMHGLRQRVMVRCLVGGIDSNLGSDFLHAFQHFSVLKTPSNADGFIPGEAAAFLLLERADVAQRRDAPILGVLEAPTRETEPFHRLSDTPVLGEVLARTIRQTLTTLPDAAKPPGLFIGSLNGETYRAMDWGYAQVRLKAASEAMDEYAEWYPAVSFGEIGAATGPAAVCLGVRAFDRGYAGTDHILIWLASEGGARAAVSLQRVEPGARQSAQVAP